MKNIDESDIQKRFQAISQFQLPRETVDADLERIREAINQKMNPSQTNTATLWRMIIKSKIAKISAAAVIILAVLIGISQLGEPIDGAKPAFAEVPHEVFDRNTKAKFITYQTTFYTKVSNKDESKTWVETEIRRLFFMAPNMYRQEFFDKDMQIRKVEVADSANWQELVLIPAKKKAVVYHQRNSYQSEGPFVWYLQQLKEHPVEWIGQKDTQSGQVNIFRVTLDQLWTVDHLTYDYWIDTETKQLVALHNPGADIFDIEKNPPTENPPDEGWIWGGGGGVYHDINFNAELDESLFSMEIPQDYTVEHVNPPQVTEQELIGYIGVLAELNDGVFTDQIKSPGAAFTEFTVTKHKEIAQKPKNERTPIEQKFLDTEMHFANKGVSPTFFLYSNTVEDTFMYVGKGVTLGDKDKHRIVCWYQLKSTNKYRAVYGDLSVRDVDPKDLPLKVIR